MKQNYQYIPCLNAYDRGFQKGMTIALHSEKIDVSKHNPYNPFLSHSNWKSFKLGLQAGFIQGIRIREQNQAINRFNELNQIEKSQKSKNLDLER